MRRMSDITAQSHQQGKKKHAVKTAVAASHQSLPYKFCYGLAVCPSNLRERERIARSVRIPSSSAWLDSTRSVTWTDHLLQHFWDFHDLLCCLTRNQNWETRGTSHSNIDRIRFKLHYGFPSTNLFGTMRTGCGAGCVMCHQHRRRKKQNKTWQNCQRRNIRVGISTSLVECCVCTELHTDVVPHSRSPFHWFAPWRRSSHRRRVPMSNRRRTNIPFASSLWWVGPYASVRWTIETEAVCGRVTNRSNLRRHLSKLRTHFALFAWAHKFHRDDECKRLWGDSCRHNLGIVPSTGMWQFAPSPCADRLHWRKSRHHHATLNTDCSTFLDRVRTLNLELINHLRVEGLTWMTVTYRHTFVYLWSCLHGGQHCTHASKRVWCVGGKIFDRDRRDRPDGLHVERVAQNRMSKSSDTDNVHLNASASTCSTSLTKASRSFRNAGRSTWPESMRGGCRPRDLVQRWCLLMCGVQVESP